MAGDDEGFSFGDFNFVTPRAHPQLQPQSINGGLARDDDDDWGDFFVAHPQPQTPIASGFSLPSQHNPNPPMNPKSSANFDTFSFNPAPHATDPGRNNIQKFRGAIPLSVFGEDEDEKEEPDSIDSGSKSSLQYLLDPNPSAQNGKVEVNGVSNGGGFNYNRGLLGANLYAQNQQIKPENGLDLNSGISDTAITMPSVDQTSAVSASDLNNLDGADGGDDEWEFMDAFSGNGFVRGNEEQGASVLPGSKLEASVLTSQQKLTGQDASNSAEHKHGSNISLPQFVDLFAAHPEAIHKSNKIDVGLNNVSITDNTNGFVPDLFCGDKAIGDGTEINVISVNGDDDFDDFGDFVDASQEVGSQNQEQSIPQRTEAEFPNGKIQEQQARSESSKGPLPLSLFSDGLAHQDEVVHETMPYPGNGAGTQGLGLSIDDLLSNLYSQAQQTSSGNSSTSAAENGVEYPQKTEDATPFNDEDDWDDNSWEFKGASPETRIKEQASSARPGTLSYETPYETTPDLQFYIDFFIKLKESLCVLLSHQLNEAKKSQRSNTTDDNENTKVLNHDIQEAYRLLEGNIRTDEFLSEKDLDKNDCLREVHETLQGPKGKVIESVYSLSERLQLATNDWRVSAELLRHAVSVLHVLSLGSSDEHSVYVSTWSKIISVCSQELKHGSLIWKQAFQNNLQAQILSDRRGQQYIQALGEIYKVVELLRLSIKLYKPWMLLSVSDSQLLGLLDECESLWSSSGLEDALQTISNNAELGINEAAEVLSTSIKNIYNIDELAVHNCVFVQRQLVCRLSLLPREMLSGLKVVLWDQEPYFLNLANLWANLISCDPPQFPHLLVS